ncbi:cytochrome o ubiquinol oxidase subunit IV [Xylophilus sp. GOD-11R]|uniref:cytochrome o ubiquinol oxidase subunit IV n=1 Tax=Xylophilus sp. GOD-11R TaxID=3089814 RepID=UPI00298BDE19|nr:cytochrome o ubiquinol oxidase subunit IV [Xylophilus sp. GOD-11R]WPB59329.1 cytochrome o ubiquinol oxidase subunit IV [Xylophilus sp. GOD-11R]
MSTYTENHFQHGRHIAPEDSQLPDEHGHHDDDHGGHSESTLGGYAIGFILSVILTAIPFWIVMTKVFDNSHTTAMVILAFAAVQIVVHMVYFLHMNSRSEGGWSMLAMIFTIIVVVITLSGSLWVMFHLNANMMPVNAHDMKNMP